MPLFYSHIRYYVYSKTTDHDLAMCCKILTCMLDLRFGGKVDEAMFYE